MKSLSKLRAYAAVVPRGRRNRADLVRYLVRRPALLAAIGTYEAAVMVSNSVDAHLKSLALIKSSALTGCPF